MERGEERRRHESSSNEKVVFLLLCPLPIHPSLLPLPHVKQFCCCLVDYQSRPALPCKASQGKKRRSSSPRPLCHFVTREQQGFRQNLLESPHGQVASPSELAEPKMKPKINFLFAEQTFGSHMFVCTLTLPGQNPDADLSENRTGSVCKTSLIIAYLRTKLQLTKWDRYTTMWQGGKNHQRLRPTATGPQTELPWERKEG